MKKTLLAINIAALIGVSGCLGTHSAADAQPTPEVGRIVAPSANASAERDGATVPGKDARVAEEAKVRVAPKPGAPPVSHGYKRHGAVAVQTLGPVLRLPAEPVDREVYGEFDENPVKQVVVEPVSTFSIDVDTGSYANVRRILNEGRLPRHDAVRVEELINYFGYADPAPEDRAEPFRVSTEFGPNPWNPKTRLLRVGVKAWQAKATDLPPANLVFLLDVSGSMAAQDKLPLLKKSLKLLLKELDKDDRVSIVVYAGASGVVLEPTPGDQAVKIEQALDKLRSGGSTNGGAGIKLAYAKAREAFIEGGINRVILATDGDFNVGMANHQQLINLVERQRKSGIALTTLGFGRGNYREHLMEQLADHGNGNHAYIDTLMEARKVLVEEMGSTLHTVAKDVKLQIEFNPAKVAEYRLIGYENRRLRREDFSNDRVDAGDVGAGHSVVALYEVALKGDGGERIAPLRYGSNPDADKHGDEIAHLRVRYKLPSEDRSKLLTWPIQQDQLKSRLAETSDDYRFAASVAAFGQHLRGGKYLEGFDLARIAELARESRGDDPRGYRSDFLRVVGLAESLQPAKVAGGGRRTVE